MPEILKQVRQPSSIFIQSFLPWLLMATTLAGCSAHDPYPAEWPPIVISTSNSCNFAPTVYRNFNREHWGQKNIIDILFDKKHTLLLKTVFVSIAQPEPDQLNVGLFNAEGRCIYKKTLSIAGGDYKCVNGWLRRDTVKVTNSGGFRGTENNTFELIQQDDYLVFKQLTLSKGWFGLFPVRGRGTSWGRFKSTNYLTKLYASGSEKPNAETKECLLTEP